MAWASIAGLGGFEVGCLAAGCNASMAVRASVDLLPAIFDQRLNFGKLAALLRPAEFGAAGAGVFADFLFGGAEGFGGDGGIEAGAFAGAEGFVGGAVFAGGVGDDGCDSAGLEDVGEDGEEAVEVGQFAVDEDAEGLEGAGGGVEFGAGGALQGEVAGLADDGGILGWFQIGV